VHVPQRSLGDNAAAAGVRDDQAFIPSAPAMATKLDYSRDKPLWTTPLVFIPKLTAYFTPFAPSVPTLTFAPEAMELAKDAPLVQGAENKHIRKLYITGLEASYVAPPGKYWYQASVRDILQLDITRGVLSFYTTGCYSPDELRTGVITAAAGVSAEFKHGKVQNQLILIGGHGGEQASTGAPAIQAWDGGQAVWVPILPLLDLFHHSMPTALQQATTYFVESCFVGRKEASLQEAATTLARPSPPTSATATGSAAPRPPSRSSST